MIFCKTDDAMDVEKEDLYHELEIMRKIPHHLHVVGYLGCCTQQGIYMLGKILSPVFQVTFCTKTLHGKCNMAMIFLN